MTVEGNAKVWNFILFCIANGLQITKSFLYCCHDCWIWPLKERQKSEISYYAILPMVCRWQKGFCVVVMTVGYDRWRKGKSLKFHTMLYCQWFVDNNKRFFIVIMTVGYESLKEMHCLKLHTKLYCQWFVDDNKRLYCCYDCWVWSLREIKRLTFHTMLYCQWFLDDNKRVVVMTIWYHLWGKLKKKSDITYYAILSMVCRWQQAFCIIVMTVGYDLWGKCKSLTFHTMLYCQWFVDGNKRFVLLLWLLGMTAEEKANVWNVILCLIIWRRASGPDHTML